jgi:DNA-binding transcriptional ArsR family regulator
MESPANTGYREPLHVASHPRRWRILELLLDSPRTVGELVHELDVAQPGVSHHLARLREAGLVQVVADGRHRCYGWAEAAPVSVARQLLDTLRSWIAGGIASGAECGSRMAPRIPIEVHLL